MRKIFFVLGVIVAVIIVVGLIVSAQLNDETPINQEVKSVVEKVSAGNIST